MAGHFKKAFCQLFFRNFGLNKFQLDFQVPKRYSHRVTTSPPTLYASTVDAEVEGSGLPDVVTSTQFTTSKKILATLGDMSAYFTTARPTTMRISSGYAPVRENSLTLGKSVPKTLARAR